MSDKKFYEKLAQVYPEEMFVMSTKSGVDLYEFVCAVLDTFKGSLVDVGCGKGRFSIYYSENNPHQDVLGIDIAQTNVRTAHLRAKLEGLKAQFVEADITQPLLSLPTNQYDNLICIETLEHLPNLGLAVSNIGRLVKPGGFALITVPNQKHFGDGNVPSNEYLQAYGINESYFHQGYTLDELKKLFEADFDVLDARIACVKSVLLLTKKG